MLDVHFRIERDLDREILRLLVKKKIQNTFIAVDAKVNINESCLALEGDPVSVHEAIEELDGIIRYFVIKRICISQIVYESLSKLPIDFIETKLQMLRVVAGVDLRGQEVHTCCINSNDSTLTEEIIQSLIDERHYSLSVEELNAIHKNPIQWEKVHGEMKRSHTSVQVLVDAHQMMIHIAAALDIEMQALLRKLQSFFQKYMYRKGVITYHIYSKPFLSLISLHSERIRKDFSDPSVHMAIDISKMECTLHADTEQHALEAKAKLENLYKNVLTKTIQESNKSLLHWFDTSEGEDRLTLWRMKTGTFLQSNPGNQEAENKIILRKLNFKNLGKLEKVDSGY